MCYLPVRCNYNFYDCMPLACVAMTVQHTRIGILCEMLDLWLCHPLTLQERCLKLH